MTDKNTKIMVATRIAVGISQCLMGESVRYDGGHKHDFYITGTLQRYFELIPVCPELAIGLGVPREPIRLVGNPKQPRAVGIRNASLDVTQKLQEYGLQQSRELAQLCGYIFKRGSPSCGMERVKVYGNQGMSAKQGSGIYAQVFMQQQPLIPCEEEGRLGDPQLRENFIQRVFVLHRWRILRSSRLTAAKLVEFHSRHKYMVMAHSLIAYKDLGRLIATAGKTGIRDLADNYILQLMNALKCIATRKQHANVLEHLLGYLKKSISKEDKQELLDSIREYRLGELPLVVPITLLKHHFRHHPDLYIEKQYYLSPHPRELMLRNMI